MGSKVAAIFSRTFDASTAQQGSIYRRRDWTTTSFCFY